MACFAVTVALVSLPLLGMLLRRVVWPRLFPVGTGEATCRCGYPLGRLDRARCPECGRVTHFDATPEELGLTEEQLEQIARRQKTRRESKE